MPKRQKYTMGNYSPSEEESKAWSWGVQNGIKIYPVAMQGVDKQWYLEVERAGKPPATSPNSYGPVEVWRMLYHYYLFYYAKREKD